MIFLHIYLTVEKKKDNNVEGVFLSDTNEIVLYNDELNDFMENITQSIVELREMEWGDPSISDKISHIKRYITRYNSKIKRSDILIHELVHFFDNKNDNIKDSYLTSYSTNVRNIIDKMKKIIDAMREKIEKEGDPEPIGDLQKQVDKLIELDKNVSIETRKKIYNTYINLTHEINAHFLQTLFKVENFKSFKDFLYVLNNHSDKDFIWISKLSKKNKRKVLKRFYDYYQKRS